MPTINYYDRQSKTYSFEFELTPVSRPIPTYQGEFRASSRRSSVVPGCYRLHPSCNAGRYSPVEHLRGDESFVALRVSARLIEGREARGLQEAIDQVKVTVETPTLVPTEVGFLSDLVSMDSALEARVQRLEGLLETLLKSDSDESEAMERLGAEPIDTYPVPGRIHLLVQGSMSFGPTLSYPDLSLSEAIRVRVDISGINRVALAHPL